MKRKAAAAPSTVGISKRPGGGGREGREGGGDEGKGGGKGGGVLPKRLQSGSVDHRLGNCGPSNGRHKIAQDRPDVLALFRSLPSAIEV